MVKVCIIPKNETQTDEIVEFLLEGKYLLTAMVIENVAVASLDDNRKKLKSKKNLITGIIRSLQFSTLNERLRKKYKENMPVLYSVPITHMDPDQADSIIQYTTRF